MLVEALPSSHPKQKAPGQHRRRSRCCLSNNCRVYADERAGDPGANLQPLGGVAMPPRTLHTKGLWPCWAIHG
jgi:hypothetical protein